MLDYSKFRAAFVGERPHEFSVSPGDGSLKQHEATQFVLKYLPHSLGVSSTHFVIEPEVRKMSIL